MHKFCSRSHPDSCQISSLAAIDCDVSWVFPKRCPIWPLMLPLYQRKRLILALLCQVNFSRAPIKLTKRWWGSELRRKTGSSWRFEKTDTVAFKWFRMQVVVFVSFKVSSWTKVHSKWNIAKILKNLLTRVLKTKRFQLVKKVSRIWYTLLR